MGRTATAAAPRTRRAARTKKRIVRQRHKGKAPAMEGDERQCLHLPLSLGHLVERLERLQRLERKGREEEEERATEGDEKDSGDGGR